jgi:hypothetical protein
MSIRAPLASLREARLSQPGAFPSLAAMLPKRIMAATLLVGHPARPDLAIQWAELLATVARMEMAPATAIAIAVTGGAKVETAAHQHLWKEAPQTTMIRRTSRHMEITCQQQQQHLFMHLPETLQNQLLHNSHI